MFRRWLGAARPEWPPGRFHSDHRCACRSIPPLLGSVPEYLEPEPVWLMPGKRPGKNYRPSQFLPPGSPRAATDISEKRCSVSELRAAKDWHGVRIDKGSHVTLGSSDDEGFQGRLPGGDPELVRPGLRRGDVTHQGSGQYRGCAA